MFHPWPDIQSFYNLRRSVLKVPTLVGENPVVRYRAKVKLHGTNAGVRVNTDGNVLAQSRSQSITPTSDNAGFAKWVAENKHVFKHISYSLAYHLEEDVDSDILVFGEWCGPGIQRGTAVNEIEEKTFAVFSILHIKSGKMLVDPVKIVYVLSEGAGLNSLKIIPWHSSVAELNPQPPFQVDIDFSALEGELDTVLNAINAEVDAVEKCDPWVKFEYGVEGIGEGLVFYAVSPEHSTLLANDLLFKAKGEKHKVVAKTKAVQASVPVAEGLTEFVEMVLTEARLEQGARAISNGELEFDTKKIGDFLKWIATDIKKETTEELLAAGLEEKAVMRACSDRARFWYLSHTKKV